MLCNVISCTRTCTCTRTEVRTYGDILSYHIFEDRITRQASTFVPSKVIAMYADNVVCTCVYTVQYLQYHCYYVYRTVLRECVRDVLQTVFTHTHTHIAVFQAPTHAQRAIRRRYPEHPVRSHRVSGRVADACLDSRPKLRVFRHPAGANTSRANGSVPASDFVSRLRVGAEPLPPLDARDCQGLPGVTLNSASARSPALLFR